MGDKTAIEWADATWNPLRGTKGTWSCIKISTGCQFCYAERFNVRQGGPEYTVGADTLRLDEEILSQPLRWKRPRRIFVCSMTDLFEERVPDDWIKAILAVMILAGQHVFQVLTKRAERMCRFMQEIGQRPQWGPYPIDEGLYAMKCLGLSFPPSARLYGRGLAQGWPPDNLWLGVSVETQARADERIPWLLKTPAAVRFLSVEPLLGPVQVSQSWVDYLVGWETEAERDRRGDPYPVQVQTHKIDWVIVGGESGGPPERALVEPGSKDYRSMGYRVKDEALEWVRSLRDQTQACGTAFFLKQWGGPRPTSGGRLLDGREWSEFPKGPNDG